jgi:acid stress-induced BolA-like protein IbaG/YrbA
MQARQEGPYQVTRNVSPVVYEAIIDGIKKRVHAINMKPKARVETKHGDRAMEDKGLSG